MSDFFATPPSEPPEPEPAQPPWLGPPSNEFGVPVPLRLVLARTEEVAVALADLVAFSTGVEFRVEVRLRDFDELSDPFGLHRRRFGAGLTDDVLRFGFELADGRRVTNLGHFPAPGERQDGPVLIQRGGGGGGRSWSFGYWLWPLPPPGGFTMAVEWPAKGVGLTRVPLDTEPLLEAAALSEKLWPGDDPDAGGGSIIQVG